MNTLSELIDRGIHAFAGGETEEAERCWQAALKLEPGNRRVLAYLQQLHSLAGVFPENEAAGAEQKSVPLPAPSAGGEGHPEFTAAAGGRETFAAPPANGEQPSGGEAAAPSDEFAPSPWDQGPFAGSPIVLEPGGGLDLSAVAEKSDLRPLVPERERPTPAPPKSDVDIWMGGARELFALGDFSGSLEMIEKILKVNPNHAEAWAYLKQNEATLVAMYESKLGPLSSVPRLAIKPEEVMWLNLDHRAGFLLAQIDGTVNYEDLFALSGLPRLDTAKILATLLNDGVIR